MNTWMICEKCEKLFDAENSGTDYRTSAYDRETKTDPSNVEGEFCCPHCGHWQEGAEVGMDDIVDAYNLSVDEWADKYGSQK